MALKQAQQAFVEYEVPVGAVITHQGRVVRAAHNQREQLRDTTAHAEMIAITQAAEAVGSWRLEHCALYVTLEPCPRCAGAILQSRLPLVIYGATDPKALLRKWWIERTTEAPRRFHTTWSVPAGV